MNNLNDAKEVVKKLAEELVSVQPMPATMFKDLIDASKDEEWLVQNGYKPVSELKILWRK